MECKAWKVWDMECETWSAGHGVWDMESGT